MGYDNRVDMSSPSEIWLAEFPHRILIWQVLNEMVKATQCSLCGRGDCKVKNGGTHSVFMGEVYVPPRCSFDLSNN